MATTEKAAVTVLRGWSDIRANVGRWWRISFQRAESATTEKAAVTAVTRGQPYKRDGRESTTTEKAAVAALQRLV